MSPMVLNLLEAKVENRAKTGNPVDRIVNTAIYGAINLSNQNWSGKPGSNRRPQPWQGCALPTELFPHTPK